jgi:hypothetical protein
MDGNAIIKHLIIFLIIVDFILIATYYNSIAIIKGPKTYECNLAQGETVCRANGMCYRNGRSQADCNDASIAVCNIQPAGYNVKLDKVDPDDDLTGNSNKCTLTDDGITIDPKPHKIAIACLVGAILVFIAWMGYFAYGYYQHHKSSLSSYVPDFHMPHFMYDPSTQCQ